MTAQLVSLDGNILLWFQDYIRTPVLTPIMKVLSWMADGGICWIVLTLVLLLFAKTRRTGFCNALALLLSLLICNILLKNLVARVRPYEVVEGLSSLVGPMHDLSFPSGHSSTSFASATAITLSMSRENRRRWSVLLYVLAVLICISRLYVGVHYPTDVLAGAAIGIFCGVCGAKAGLTLAERIPWVRGPL